MVALCFGRRCSHPRYGYLREGRLILRTLSYWPGEGEGEDLGLACWPCCPQVYCCSSGFLVREMLFLGGGISDCGGNMVDGAIARKGE